MQCHPATRIETEPAGHPGAEFGDLDPMALRGVMRRHVDEPHRPAFEPFRQAICQQRDEVADPVGVGWTEKDLAPGSPVVIGRSGRIESEHVRTPADQRRGVPQARHVLVEQRPDDVPVVARGQLGAR
jgi:hypothetical protein